MEKVLAVLARGYGPVKLLFGLGLLFNGTAFAHLILFTHAFNISGTPLLRSALLKIAAAGKLRALSGRQPGGAMASLSSALQPQPLLEVLSGVHYGVVACIAAVVSPVAGAAGVGLSVGQILDRHVQPLVRRYWMTNRRLLSMAEGRRVWADAAVSYSASAVSVLVALSSIKYINVLSGSLLGAQWVVDQALLYLEQLLSALAARSSSPLVHRAASSCCQHSHPLLGGSLTIGIAAASFFSQLNAAPQPTSMPFKVLFCLPLFTEKVLSAFKWIFLARK